MATKGTFSTFVAAKFQYMYTYRKNLAEKDTTNIDDDNSVWLHS